ncbi:sulfurtransferase [Alphaproteobacteria bacterium]|nr:sulfurtransferase [Alphaproteobacteria bacterium]
MRFAKLFAVALAVIFTGFSASAQPLVDTSWAKERLSDDKVVFIDLRNKIDGGNYETWLEGHLPGSVHSDYLTAGWRVGRDDVVGLLPSEGDFSALAQKLGVSADSHVVLIPAGVSSTDFGSAARAYWTFKVFGHQAVSILDGGYAKWVKDFPNSIEQGSGIAPAPGDFIARFDDLAYATTTGVQAALGDDGVLLLDARTEEQFIGDAKHGKALQAGHIPGAVLQSQADAYDAGTNQLKSVAELSEIYADHSDKPIISYCNTGHWAATNWFVLSEVLGRQDVKLYDGSMVEWTANSNNPLGTQSNMDKLKNLFQSFTGS